MLKTRHSDNERAELIAEREALEELVKSDGWRVFRQKVVLEWQGAGYYERMGAAVVAVDPLMPKLVHNTSIEMQHMLTWPIARIRELGGVVEP